MNPYNEFIGFPKIARLNRDCIITEKIDGTNACVVIDLFNKVFAQSRTRQITPANDNFGFARWVEEHNEELLQLGPGYHFGEWWGRGIQRGYGLDHKRFSLFRTPKDPFTLPTCVSVVPLLREGAFHTNLINDTLSDLIVNGSQAAPGFMQPEGIIIWHKAAGTNFKVTIENDKQHKSDVVAT